MDPRQSKIDANLFQLLWVEGRSQHWATPTILRFPSFQDFHQGSQKHPRCNQKLHATIEARPKGKQSLLTHCKKDWVWQMLRDGVLL
jgi:protein tyrosine/serine phosphatase